MTIGLWMKLFHVLTAIGLFTGAIGRHFAFARAITATDLASKASLMELSEEFEVRLFFPAGIGVFIFGLLTAWLNNWPIFGFLGGSGENWLLTSLVLWLIMSIISPAFLAARRKKRKTVLEEAMEKGTITPELNDALKDRVVVRVRMLELTVYTLILVLMVTKPF